VLVAAAILRLGHLWATADAPFVGEPVLDSAEYDRWARVIAGGDWRGEGAFFQAPLYPYLVGAVYALVGARPTAVYLLQIAVAIAAIWALWRCGTLLAGWRVGLAAAALAAGCGVLVFHDVLLLKESLATSVMAFLLLALVAARRAAGPHPLWLVAGALLGVLAQLRENALLLAPLVLLLPWIDDDRDDLPAAGNATSGPDDGAPSSSRSPATTGRGRRALGADVFLALGIALALAPFALRNLVVTGEPLLTTFQGGVNLWIGNNPEADGLYRPLVAGRQVPERERHEAIRLAEAATGRRLSPREVSRYWVHRSIAWARAEPAAFLRLQARKLALFWSVAEWPDAVDYGWMRQRSPALGLAFVERGALSLLAVAGIWLERRRLRRWAPVLLLLFGWMAATVAFFLFSRYRLPAVPALALLAAVPVARVAALLGHPERRRTALAGAAAVTAALVVPHLLRPPPRLDLVHGNLGLLAAERGELAAAAAHYRSALEASPDDLLALLGLGNLAARERRFAEALAYFGRAAAAHPESPEAVANLGATELAVGRTGDAEAHFARALALDPDDLVAAHNMSLLLARRGALDEAREWNRRVVAGAPPGSALHTRATALAARLAAAASGPAVSAAPTPSPRP
jgi:Flp pilus assembly protein TadD